MCTGCLDATGLRGRSSPTRPPAGARSPPHRQGSERRAPTTERTWPPPRSAGGPPIGRRRLDALARRARAARGRRHPRLVAARRRTRARTRQLAGRGPARPRRCPTTPWCCTAAASPTAADPPDRPDRPGSSGGRMWQAGTGAPLSPRRRPAPPGRRVVRRAGHRGWRHRRRRRPRRGQPGAADGPGREGRLRLGHLVEVLQDGPRRHPLPPAAGVPARLREPGRAPAPARQRARTSSRPSPS